VSRVRIERLAIVWLKSQPSGTDAPDITQSRINGGICELRGLDGRVLAEIAIDGSGSLTVGWEETGFVGWAIIEPFRLVIRCCQCGRRHFEPSDAYEPTTQYTCARCGALNLRPSAAQIFGG
jgi:hypothetical protein